jgi:hypothetical protein
MHLVWRMSASLYYSRYTRREVLGAGASSKWMGVIASMSLQHQFTARSVPQREFRECSCVIAKKPVEKVVRHRSGRGWMYALWVGEQTSLATDTTAYSIIVSLYACQAVKKQRKRSRYSDWLRAGWPRGRSSSPGSVKNFHLSMLSRPFLGLTEPPLQWIPRALSPGVKRPGVKLTISN